MGRWEPDAKGRLADAALELYCEQGYDNTTVAEIATRAGLTERTFFRHFADKREVLFVGSVDFQGLFVDAVAQAPDSASPMDAVAAALHAVAAFFEGQKPRVRRRQAIITAHPELQERELIKLATVSRLMAEALRRRGVTDLVANLTAEAGVSVFRTAFERWATQNTEEPLAHVMATTLDELRAAVT
jgi:AcrR family transcriptional regulator